MHSLYKVNKWRNFMAKAELGNKHLCASCGTKFYDLKKEVPKCPKCGAEIIIKIKHLTEAHFLKIMKTANSALKSQTRTTSL